MINREIIRIKIVQLTYAYYQNGNHNLENAEKELVFSLDKAYDLYNFLLDLIVAVTRVAQQRYDVAMARFERGEGDCKFNDEDENEYEDEGGNMNGNENETKDKIENQNPEYTDKE